jgi:hypothetical protein
MERKPVIWVDNSPESKRALQFLNDNRIEYVDHNIADLENGCCGGPSDTKAPVLFAPNGIFRNLDGILNYISKVKQNRSEPSASAFW